MSDQPGARAQKLYEFLSEEGFRPQYDQDGDVEFKAEGYYLCCFASENDTAYLYVAAPHIWSLEGGNQAERLRALEVAAELQLTYKGLKVLVLSDTVWAAYQGFLASPEDFRALLPRVIDLLLTGVRDFHREMRDERPAGDAQGVQA